MKHDIVPKLEERLRAGIAAAKALGWTIIPHETIVADGKCCCAIGACIVTDPLVSPLLHDVYSYGKGALGLNTMEIESFVRGFDHSAKELSCRTIDDRPTPCHEDLYQLGRKLRAEFVAPFIEETL